LIDPVLSRAIILAGIILGSSIKRFLATTVSNGAIQ
jgi:hypothetical protein